MANWLKNLTGLPADGRPGNNFLLCLLLVSDVEGGKPGCLTSLFLLRRSSAAGRQFRFLPFAVQAHQYGERPDLAGSEGKGYVQREDNPTVAEGKEGPLLSGTQRVVMHAGAPDVASGFARQSVVNGADEDFGTKGEQKLEDAVPRSSRFQRDWLKKR